MNADRAHSSVPANSEQISECRVVGEVEPQPRRVDEQELSCHPELQLVFALDDLARDLCELGERLLYRGVLHWIQLDSTQCAVERNDEIASAPAQIRSRDRIVRRSSIVYSQRASH